MASLLLTVGVLSYDQIKKQKAKRALKKEHNSVRFSELEAENARRITALQNNTCFCQTSDWRGGNCERHGYVPAAGELGGPVLARKSEGDGDGDDGDGDMPPPEYEERVAAGAAAVPSEEYRDTTTTLRTHGSNERQQQQRPYGEIGYQYQRGEEDGFLAGIPYSNGVRREGLPSQEGDVERINGERRRGRTKKGGFANWGLKRKEGRGEAVVR